MDPKADPLIDGKARIIPWEEQCWWKVTHAFGFVLGGITFWAGTFLYWYPLVSAFGLQQGDISAWLYIIGSCGFLYVDVLEFFTFTEDCKLRLNISMSMTGSLLYVIGSAGFLSYIYATTTVIGIQGFIWGSFWIAVSQTWKVVRIAQESEGGTFGSKDSFTATCVEGGAQLGAQGFLWGTILYYYIQDALEGPLWNDVLCMWLFGSTTFTVGGIFLTYRHAVMGL